MAGMLPGVESARRRRLHQSGDSDNNRRSSFCLYTPKINHNNSTHRSVLNHQQHQSHQDEKLEQAARDAKERLDEKFKRRNTKTPKGEIFKCMRMDGRVMELADLQTEVLGHKNMKKNGSKIFGRKISDSDQEECAICLDTFKTGNTLVILPCAHRFHSNCLTPWLETNAHCPFCRAEIFS